MSSIHLVLILDLLVLAAGALMAMQDRMVPAMSIFGAFGVLAVWQILLASVSDSFSRTYRWEVSIRPTHYVQAALHLSMYTYLGLYWDGVGRYAPLIITQIFFGYLLDMLLSWTRGRVWRIGLGVLPIVFSTNLFLWFREPVFYLQLALIALTFLGKEFVTWQYDGRRRHIVNPSAFSLSIVSLLLLVTGTEDWSHAVDIAAAFDTPPNFYEFIFLLGLVVQALFVVTPVTLGAASALYLIFLLTPLAIGSQLSAVPIHSAVFLGMTFLVTDPATSPRSHFGRFLFGFAYGTCVFALFLVLRYAHKPAIFDKLLAVPLLNLCVPLIDRFCDWSSRFWLNTQAVSAKPTNVARFGWLAAYIALFMVMLPSLKSPQFSTTSFLPPPEGNLSPDVKRILNAMIYCRFEYPEAFRPFGFRAEIANFETFRAFYHNGPPASRRHRASTGLERIDRPERKSNATAGARRTHRHRVRECRSGTPFGTGPFS